MAKRMIFVLGLPGSGKSEHVQRKFGDCPGVIEYDLIRAALGHVYHWSTEPHVHATACTMARMVLSRGDLVVIDECLTIPAMVADLVRIAREHEAQVEMRFLDVPASECWIRRAPCGFPRQDFDRKLLEWQRHRSEIIGMAHEVRLLSPDGPWASSQDTSPGVALIAAERRRQVEAEGFSAEYDDTRQDSELAWAACYYAMPCIMHVDGCQILPQDIFAETGWDQQWAKRDHKSRVRQLAVAGALIAAEIDRLQRAGLDYGGQQPGDKTETSA
jgi:predicted kinase